MSLPFASYVSAKNIVCKRQKHCMVMGETLYANDLGAAGSGRPSPAMGGGHALPVMRFYNIFGGDKLTNT